MKRRTFLRGVSVASLAAGAPLPTRAATATAGQSFDAEQWTIIETVQNHLLPSEPNAPGSSDIAATAYLDRTLADPKFDPDIRSFIFNGIGWLDDLAREQTGKSFPLIEPARREDLLVQIAQTSSGERWLSNLLTYLFEALLADPLYGGNPDGIGWAWLEHDPGQPRPTPDKIYGRLGKA